MMFFSNPFAILLCMFARALVLTAVSEKCLSARHRVTPHRLGAHFCGFCGNYRVFCRIFYMCSRRNKWKDRKTNIEKCALPEYQMKTSTTSFTCLCPPTEFHSLEAASQHFYHSMRESKVKNNNIGTKKVMREDLSVFFFFFLYVRQSANSIHSFDASLTGFRQAIDGFSDDVGSRREQVDVCVCVILGTALGILCENAQWIMNGNKWISFLAREKRWFLEGS